MKDKKHKKAIRAQKARMGETTSYSAARLVLTRSNGKTSAEVLALEDRIRAVIPLAAAARGRRSGSDPIETPVASNPKAALVQALRLFSVEDLYRLHTVMYAGRDVDDTDDIRSQYHGLHQGLPRHTRDVTIFGITEKAPLATYLERGLELARKAGMSLIQLGAIPSATEDSSPPTAAAPPPPQSQVSSEEDQDIDFGVFRREANAAWLKALQHATGKKDLSTRTWTDPKEIVEVLRAIGVPNSNHMFFPTGGGNDLASATIAREAGCIELFCHGEDGDRGSPEIVKPRSLTLNAIAGIPSMSYLRLELDELAPSGVYDSVSNGREELTETEPLQYEDRSLWDDGEYVPSHRLVTRWLRGSFVIFAKGSLYNAFDDYWEGDTYDGRHSKMDAAQFRKYVYRIVGSAIERGLPTH